MEKSESQRRKFRSVLIISLSGIIVGILFTDIAFGFDLAHTIKGATAGFIITFLIALSENYLFRNRFRKLRFSIVLLLRTLVYVTVISFAVVLVWVTHESLLNSIDVFTTLKSEDFRFFIIKGDFKNILIFAFIVSFIINLFTQVNNLLGKRVFLNYVTGKYHDAKEEERVFMFLDLTSSTTIAEKLGPVRYHKFINSCFFDIDVAILESKGEVYQYVGDEVVITWKGNEGFTHCDCISCFFRIRERLDEFSEKYMRNFGFVPEFKAGLHCGQVVTGEIGDSKREIVFTGDVLNTASRIQSQCNLLNSKLIVSEDILKRLSLPSDYSSESLGVFRLRGKEMGVELYKVIKN
jgi:adenylate cyclase